MFVLHDEIGDFETNRGERPAAFLDLFGHKFPGFNNGNTRLPTKVASIPIHRNKAVMMAFSFRKIELSLIFTNTLDRKSASAKEDIQVA